MENRDLNTLIKSRPKTGMSQAYALTITLRPMLYKHVAYEQYRRSYVEVFDLFKRHGCEITLVTELTKQYNVHYHGIVQVPMILCSKQPGAKTIFDMLRQLKYIGHTVVDPITDEEGWNRYICKDQTALHWAEYPIYSTTDHFTAKFITTNRNEYWLLKEQNKTE